MFFPKFLIRLKGELQMKKNLFLTTAFLIFSTCISEAASAQMTITIPKIPKVKKSNPTPPPTPTPTPTTSTPTTNSENRSSDSQPNSNQTTPQSAPSEEKLDFRLSFFLDEIAKTQKVVDSFDPNTRSIFVSRGSETEWTMRAVSKREREKFAGQWLKTAYERKRFDDALDALNASVAKQLPLYAPKASLLAVRNPVEERMIRAKLPNLSSLQIYKIGLQHANWQVDKNEFGIPNGRYKNGHIWAQYK
jgi:hypothetical protein